MKKQKRGKRSKRGKDKENCKEAKTALETEMGTVPKQKAKGSKPPQEIEEEEMKKTTSKERTRRGRNSKSVRTI